MYYREISVEKLNLVSDSPPKAEIRRDVVDALAPTVREQERKFHMRGISICCIVCWNLRREQSRGLAGEERRDESLDEWRAENSETVLMRHNWIRGSFNVIKAKSLLVSHSVRSTVPSNVGQGVTWREPGILKGESGGVATYRSKITKRQQKQQSPSEDSRKFFPILRIEKVTLNILAA